MDADPQEPDGENRKDDPAAAEAQAEAAVAVAAIQADTAVELAEIEADLERDRMASMRDERITTLETELNECRAEMVRLSDMVTERDREIGELRSSIQNPPPDPAPSPSEPPEPSEEDPKSDPPPQAPPEPPPPSLKRKTRWI